LFFVREHDNYIVHKASNERKKEIFLAEMKIQPFFFFFFIKSRYFFLLFFIKLPPPCLCFASASSKRRRHEKYDERRRRRRNDRRTARVRATRPRVAENLFTRGLETGKDVIETFAVGHRATVLLAREDENENGGVVDARE